MTGDADPVKKFTGYHATIIIVSFFAVVITVNLIMAGFALSTFGGTIVDNSYVASQKYNQWLAAGRKQAEYGWRFSAVARSNDHITLAASDAANQPLTGAIISALAEHPVGRSEAFDVVFVETTPGHYQSQEIFPAGRWKLKITVTQQDRQYHLASEVK